MEFLLKFILIFFLVFYGVKFLFRLLMPIALRKLSERLMGKAAEQAQQGAGQGNYQYQQRNPFDQFKQAQGHARRGQEGKITVDYVPSEDAKQRRGPQTAGEFVDFEEIKK
ncbi:DUF4834 family protein [Sphingobacterium griseoflavum]|uniref:DUF4834 domain-containing protein n=1 Tax=Sphingobacterium griseoflavum TaxID=1474952 RepID=A0ABQ3HR01_9SPHI|nr:DUF4834 family protein [Sphingobacterium griseoflavum]GHE23710.1 hypothetical protein GCM10017764_06780 [Sphingobacterium griseoflavum]